MNKTSGAQYIGIITRESDQTYHLRLLKSDGFWVDIRMKEKTFTDLKSRALTDSANFYFEENNNAEKSKKAIGNVRRGSKKIRKSPGRRTA